MTTNRVEPAEVLEKLRALQRSIPFTPFTHITAHGVEYEIKSPEEIHFWPDSKTIAADSDKRIDHSLAVSSIKLINAVPVQKPATDKITVEIDHDIYKRFCNEARCSNVSPEEEAKCAIVARAPQNAAPAMRTHRNRRSQGGNVPAE